MSVSYGALPERIIKDEGDPVDFRFIQKPTQNSATGLWRWSHLKVAPSAMGGRGVFATEDIPEGLLVPYVGDLVPNHRTKNESYLMGGKVSRDGFADYDELIVDADPSLPVCQNEYCITGFLNEVSVGTHELYNCHFIDGINVKGAPFYVGAASPSFFIITLVPIKKGDELFVYYGEAYKRKTKTFEYAAKDDSPSNWSISKRWQQVWSRFCRFDKLKPSIRTETNGSTPAASGGGASGGGASGGGASGGRGGA